VTSEAVNTDDISTASKVIRANSPRVLATLLAVQGHERRTQEQIADEVGCARSTVSKYLRVLDDLPEDIIRKQGHSITVTHRGAGLINVYESALKGLDIDIGKVDWTSDEISAVDEALAPLHQFRSSAPFLVLRALISLSESSQFDQEIWIDDLIMTVETLQQESGDSISRQHFDQILDNFAKHETVTRERDELQLTQKGHQQGELLTGVLDWIRSDQESARSEPSEERPTAGRTTYGLKGMNSPKIGAFATEPGQDIESIAEQDAKKAFRGRTAHGRENAPRVGPAIFIETADELHSIGAVEGENTASLADTLRTLASRLENLEKEYDPPLPAGIYRSLVTAGEPVPLGDDWQPLDTASFAEWHMINKAFQLIGQQDQ